ncbi:hypothetical protein [Pseudonocardia oroxyli]|nr:hypothetical protein [Pseudonocardia oroxyli]
MTVTDNSVGERLMPLFDPAIEELRKGSSVSPDVAGRLVAVGLLAVAD